MVDNDLEAKIRKTIEEVYCCECTVKIKAKIVDNAYMVFFYIHDSEFNPMQLIHECETEEDFFKWFRKELQERNLMRSYFFKVILNHDQQI